MHKQPKIKLGISVGDLNGIGCEVIFKTFADSRMMDFCTPVLFASNKTISYQIKNTEISIPFNGVRDLNKLVDGKINVVNVWKEIPKIQYGEETPDGGKFAILSLKAAAKALKENKIDALVTAPINKNNIQSEDFKFPGHTDYLAQELEGQSLMFMVTDTLKVGLLTDHVPVSEVANHITTKLINDKVQIMMNSLRKDFGIINPKIALLGINPHSGDNGTIGEEDEKIMKPAINAMQEKGMHVFGPYAADSFFGSKNHQNFDAILAAYHDQGLIPFKTLSFGKGVNFTAGLSHVRTSPDHGTAFEIAGKNQADESSFKEAVFLALKVVKQRKIYKETTENQLVVKQESPNKPKDGRPKELKTTGRHSRKK
ncbi:MAG: 4-hydroxythreonine-4-phosphate dehydrogenase PdxA [Flavobacteriaceae bacterium]|nr:4-hydroxythreonine-4-phosphate dehydrogenase PdxA [Flavobacteriaceae bacterium]